MFDAAGNIYSTTESGGTYGKGTVFGLVAPAGSGNYEEKVLWNVSGPNGSQPYEGLPLDSAGNLFGATEGGGSSTYWGTVFELTP